MPTNGRYAPTSGSSAAQPPAASIISENQQVNGFDVQEGRLACPHSCVRSRRLSAGTDRSLACDGRFRRSLLAWLLMWTFSSPMRMLHARARVRVAVAVLSLLVASLARAQGLGGAGTVQGTVKDSTGGVMQAVQVRISNPVSGFSRTVT